MENRTSRNIDMVRETTREKRRLQNLLSDESKTAKQFMTAYFEEATKAKNAISALADEIESLKRASEGTASSKQKRAMADEIAHLEKQIALQEQLQDVINDTANARLAGAQGDLAQYQTLNDIIEAVKKINTEKSKASRIATENAEKDAEALQHQQALSKYSRENLDKVTKERNELAKQARDFERTYDKLSSRGKNTEYGKAVAAQRDFLNRRIAEKDVELDDIRANTAKSKIGETLEDKMSGTIDNIADALGKTSDELSSSIGKIGNTVSVAMVAITQLTEMFRGPLNAIVDGATSTVTRYFGPIAASLEGVTSGIDDFRELNKKLQSDVGLSTIVRQEKVLENISSLVESGITTDIEALGLLASIRDKTVSSFNVQDANLRRLIRLNQQRGNLTAKQFGLADALKESFNSTFGDSTFVHDMLQGLTGTVLDAVSANANSGGYDSTAFYSILDSWLGAMYESGVSQNVINNIAEGINMIGSGNINSLSGNKPLQNLMLLSMDRAGMDYASILQQGLGESDVNKLLSTIVDYLGEITDATKDNNVLQSSYANLFNLSITDMTAIQNLRKIGFSPTYLTGSSALNQAVSEISKVADRTSSPERFDNFFANAKFSFGSSVASNPASYILYKASNFILDSMNSIEKQATGGNFTSPIGAFLSPYTTPVKAATSIAYLGSMLPGVIGFGRSLLGSANNLVSDASGYTSNWLGSLITGGVEGGIYDGGTSMSGTVSSYKGSTGTTKLKSFDFTSVSAESGISDTSNWENELDEKSKEEDEITKAVKNFEKTLMKSKDSDGYAFAVSLQGMSDGVLRSFASIFADEEAMMNTLTGENNALEENNTFIDYINDSSQKVNNSTMTKV